MILFLVARENSHGCARASQAKCHGAADSAVAARHNSDTAAQVKKCAVASHCASVGLNLKMIDRPLVYEDSEKSPCQITVAVYPLRLLRIRGFRVSNPTARDPTHSATLPRQRSATSSTYRGWTLELCIQG